MTKASLAENRMCGPDAIRGIRSDEDLDRLGAWGTLHGSAVPEGTLEDRQCSGQWQCVGVSVSAVSDSLQPHGL